MKEIRYFYAPDASRNGELPEEEATHCIRVLRLQSGDEIHLTDGCGGFYRAEITTVTNKRCCFRVLDVQTPGKEWQGHLHLAVAPTKNNDRIEWLAEKATEIGFDELSFLNCRFSERKAVKTERIDKILVSAMKQSHKVFKPVVHDMEAFRSFVTRDFPDRSSLHIVTKKVMWRTGGAGRWKTLFVGCAGGRSGCFGVSGAGRRFQCG